MYPRPPGPDPAPRNFNFASLEYFKFNFNFNGEVCFSDRDVPKSDTHIASADTRDTGFTPSSCSNLVVT